METRIGSLEVSYGARGNPTYKLDIWHDGLKKHRLIRGDSQSMIKLKAQLQIEEWAQKWSDISSRQKQRSKLEHGRRQHEERKAEAQDRTSDAQAELQLLSALLRATLEVDDKVNWESLKDKASFPESSPKPATPPTEPRLPSLLPREPQLTDSKYRPTLSLFDKLIPSRRTRILQQATELFARDLGTWERDVSDLRRNHAESLATYEKHLRDIRAAHEKAVGAWDARWQAFLVSQVATNAMVDAKRSAYEAGESDAIVEYIDLVLSSSRYPDYFPQEFDIEYDASAKTAIVDYKLPAPDDLPTLKAVKYVASRDEFEEQFISEVQATRQYDDVLYQVVLRTVHELYESDVVGALEAVVINGIVTAIDRTTGKPVTACVLSLRAGRPEFAAINLAQVDPKACFKSLKGVGSSKLSGLSPVPPIMPLRRKDGRFVSAYEVAKTLDGSVNLAAMDWEDFEHLIREIFEQEFSSTGGEVRVSNGKSGLHTTAQAPRFVKGECSQ